jgi:hypothetical protein
VCSSDLEIKNPTLIQETINFLISRLDNKTKELENEIATQELM